MTDHSKVTENALKTVGNIMPSISNYLPLTAMPNQKIIQS